MLIIKDDGALSPNFNGYALQMIWDIAIILGEHFVRNFDFLYWCLSKTRGKIHIDRNMPIIAYDEKQNRFINPVLLSNNEAHSVKRSGLDEGNSWCDFVNKLSQRAQELANKR